MAFTGTQKGPEPKPKLSDEHRALINAYGDQDPYKMLDIPVTATAAEIKKAYRKWSMENHPDRIQQQGGTDSQITEAGKIFAVFSPVFIKLFSDESERQNYLSLRADHLKAIKELKKLGQQEQTDLRQTIHLTRQQEAKKDESVISLLFRAVGIEKKDLTISPNDPVVLKFAVGIEGSNLKNNFSTLIDFIAIKYGLIKPREHLDQSTDLLGMTMEIEAEKFQKFLKILKDPQKKEELTEILGLFKKAVDGVNWFNEKSETKKDGILQTLIVGKDGGLAFRFDAGSKDKLQQLHDYYKVKEKDGYKVKDGFEDEFVDALEVRLKGKLGQSVVAAEPQKRPGSSPSKPELVSRGQAREQTQGGAHH